MASSEPIGKAGTLGEKVRSLQLPKELPAESSPTAKILAYVVVAGVCLYGGWYALGRYRAAGSAQTSSSASSDRPATSTSVPATSPAAPATASTPPSAPVRSAPPAAAPTIRGDVFALESDGNIVPRHQILVSPRVSGMIVKLDVEEGMRVEKGHVLALVESIEYEADLKRAQAQLATAVQQLEEYQAGNRPEEVEAARADVGESVAKLAQLKAEWKRREALVGKRVMSESDYEVAHSEYQAMDRHVAKMQSQLAIMEQGPRKETIERARAQVQLAQAEVTKAQWRLDNTVITAPITGTILIKNAEEGNIVNPVAFKGSYSICEMADLSDLEVDLPIQERDLSKIKIGQQCQVTPKAYPQRRYQGVVNRMMPIATRAEQSVKVRIKLTVPAEEEGVYLKPEMTVTVGFLREGTSSPTGDSTPQAQ